MTAVATKITFQPAGFESSWLQGEIDVDYKDLVKVFGKEHSDGDGYKVQAEWNLKFSDGTYATIYDWKQGKNYCGSSGISKTRVRDWHIGGSTPEAVKRVTQALRDAGIAV